MTSVNKCPECGASLVGIDPYKHALTHWLEVLDPIKSSKEARERQRYLYGLAEAQRKQIKLPNLEV